MIPSEDIFGLFVIAASALVTVVVFIALWSL